MKTYILYPFLILLIFFSYKDSGVGNKSDKQNSIYRLSLYSSNNFNKDESSEEYNSAFEGRNYKDKDIVYDGEYCAKITYYNSNTERNSEYTLTIEVYENKLEKINFPNGWLDNDHFSNVLLDSQGYASFTSDRGYEYTVQIIGPSDGCFDNVPRAYRCKGITRDGGQCKRLTDNASGFCWQHEKQQ